MTDSRSWLDVPTGPYECPNCLGQRHWPHECDNTPEIRAERERAWEEWFASPEGRAAVEEICRAIETMPAGAPDAGRPGAGGSH